MLYHYVSDNLYIVMENNAISNNVKAIVGYSGELFDKEWGG